jgi:hypothetical protein
MLEAPCKKVSSSSRRSIGGAVRLKRSTSVSTSNSLSDCDTSLEIGEDNEVSNGRLSPQSKRRKSTLIWESSPKRRRSDRVRPLLQVDPAVATKEALSSANKKNIQSTDSIGGTEDADQQLKRSSTSSNNSRSNTEDKLPSERPWSLEDFVLGKALGKVTLILVAFIEYSPVAASDGCSLTHPVLTKTLLDIIRS